MKILFYSSYVLKTLSTDDDEDDEASNTAKHTGET
jgi:hypothetical protein